MSFWRKKIFRDLISSVLLVAALCSLVVIAFEVIPGDPMNLLLSDDAGPKEREALRAHLGLDQPVQVRLGYYWGRLLTGDWGKSLYFEQPLLPLVLTRMKVSALLGVLTLAFALFWTCAALFLVWRRSDREGWVLGVSHFFLSQPVFFVAPVLVCFFSLILKWTPVSGYSSSLHLVLPVLSLGLFQTAVLIRGVTPYLRQLRHSTFITVAFAKGLSSTKVFYRHAIGSLLIPMISLQTVLFGGVVGGAVLVESIFDLPGLGLLLYEAVVLRDLPLVFAIVFVVGLLFVAINLLSDLLIAYLDPRLQR